LVFLSGLAKKMVNGRHIYNKSGIEEGLSILAILI